MAYASIDWDTNSFDGSEISTGVHVVDGSSSGLNYEIDGETTVGSNETGFNLSIDGDASEYTVSIENSFLSDWLYIENDDPESGSDNEISLKIHDDYVFPYFYENGYTDSIEFSFEIELVDENNDITTIEGTNFFLENPSPVISSNDIKLTIDGHNSLAEIYEHESAGAFVFSYGEEWEYEIGSGLSLGIDLDANEDVTWTIEDDGNLFKINSDGKISWKDTPEFEQDFSTSLTVTAEDKEGKTTQVEIEDITLVAGEYTNLTTYGDNKSNTLSGGKGNDELYGLGGDDTLNGNKNDDELYGGYGDDTLYGGDDNDELYGEMGNDTLYGGDGNDRLTGGEGIDFLIGGKGDDTYVLDDELDVISDQGSSSDQDTIILRYSVQKYTLASGIRDLQFDSNVKKVNGNNLGNTIVGNSGSNTINGKSGNDTLNGGKGNDKLIGGTGKDTALFSSKSNVVDLSTTKKQNTGDGKDTLVEIENISSGGGNDKLYGSKGSNTLNGGTGNDLLIGGKGKDKLIGGKGKDIFKLSKGKGYDLIQDFKNKQDKIFIGSMKKLKLKNKGNDVYIYKEKDLLAKVKGGAEELSKQGKYLV